MDRNRGDEFVADGPEVTGPESNNEPGVDEDAPRDAEGEAKDGLDGSYGDCKRGTGIWNGF